MKKDCFGGPGQWYKGNLHSHTTNSDGHLTPAQAVALFRQYGYSFLCLSEHDYYTDLRAELDRDDFIDDSYILEVSSPGLGRPLKKERDFVRSKGEEVEIRTYRMVERQKEFRGVLKAWDKDTVTIENEDGTDQVFERDNIALIRLAFDF